jgi:serine kinase of HPr protein (carbohydrate metabolism regulator)
MILHAGQIALREAGYWRGALITGPSGAGKSDLALRCLERGFRLVADDRVILWRSGGALWGRAPEALSGLIEARGLGVLAEGVIAYSPVRLVVSHTESPERLPEPEVESLLDQAIPKLWLNFAEDSAPAKLRRALGPLG